MGALLKEIVDLLEKLPANVLMGILSMLKTLLLAQSEEDRRIATDAALAATEKAIIQKEFPG